MKHKVALVIATLQGGGAERVLSAMANYWAAKNWDVSLVTFSSTDEDFYKLDARVRRIGLDDVKPSQSTIAAVTANLRRVFRLNRVLSKLNADVVVSFLDITNITTLLSTLPMKAKVIVSERNDITQNVIPPAWDVLRRKLYKYATAVVVQTETQLPHVSAVVGSNTVLRAIPNPVSDTVGKSASSYDINCHVAGGEKLIIGMGRLERQKGFDMLIRAFAKLYKNAPDWRLLIFGEGSERAALQGLVDQLGLQDRIFLPGLISNTEQVLAVTDLFVLSSRYEGFPNALLEAMASGAAVVSFDCPAGPGDIINNEVNGVLVPKEDESALAQELQKLIDDPQRRRRLGESAGKVREIYSEGAIMAQWEELIEQVAQ